MIEAVNEEGLERETSRGDKVPVGPDPGVLLERILGRCNAPEQARAEDVPTRADLEAA